MASATPATFAALLRTAVTEPGTISTAYSAFHNYSLGNQLLALRERQPNARGLPASKTLIEIQHHARERAAASQLHRRPREL